MAEKAKQKDRYSKAPRIAKKEDEAKHSDKQPDMEVKKEKTDPAGGSEGKPEGSVTAGTDGIPTTMERHHKEMKDAHKEMQSEMEDMHSRHQDKMHAMHRRHAKEIMEAPVKQEGAEMPQGQGGTEPEGQ